MEGMCGKVLASDDRVAALERDLRTTERLRAVWKDRAARLESELQATERQLEAAARRENAAALFCDRGLVDGLAYMRLVGAPPTPFVKAAVQSSRYDVIVLCEICLPFKSRVETGRTSDLQRARDIEASLIATYREFGYELLRLPAEAPVAARADLLLDELSHLGLVARTR